MQILFYENFGDGWTQHFREYLISRFYSIRKFREN